MHESLVNFIYSYCNDWSNYAIKEKIAKINSYYKKIPGTKTTQSFAALEIDHFYTLFGNETSGAKTNLTASPILCDFY